MREVFVGIETHVPVILRGIQAFRARCAEVGYFLLRLVGVDLLYDARAMRAGRFLRAIGRIAIANICVGKELNTRERAGKVPRAVERENADGCRNAALFHSGRYYTIAIIFLHGTSGIIAGMSVNLYSIIVPAHNESENLVVLLPQLDAALQKLSREYEIIVVNNASTDDTDEAIENLRLPRVRVVREPVLGYGRAVLAGLAQSKGDMIGIIRADNQEKPDDLRIMCEAAQREGIALYKAVRKNRISDGLKRIIISFAYNMLFTYMFGLSSRDLNATPKVCTRAFLERARLESKDWFIDAEMVIKAEHLGFSIREMEIEYLPRLKGRSTVRMRHIFEFLSNMLSWYKRARHGRLLA